MTERLGKHCRFPALWTIAADTDLAQLDALTVDHKLPLGGDWTQEDGCGGDAVRGERAASASIEDIQTALAEAGLLVGLAGLGGGTGAGACKVVARLARQAKVPAMFVVTLPFSFEGEWRRQNAEKALVPLREVADAVIAIPNDRLFSALPADTPGGQAFRMADSLLAEGVAGLARIFSAEGLVTAGLDNVKAILGKNKSSCTLGVGGGDGDECCKLALEAFLTSPLTGGEAALRETDAAVLTLLGGNDLSVRDIQTCLADFQAVFPRQARMEVGAYTDEHMGKHVQLTALMCSYEGDAEQAVQSPVDATESIRRNATPKKPLEADRDGQFRLPLTEHSLGIFKPGEPTLVNGQNLDIPTFQRRGVDIDPGE